MRSLVVQAPRVVADQPHLSRTELASPFVKPIVGQQFCARKKLTFVKSNNDLRSIAESKPSVGLMTLQTEVYAACALHHDARVASASRWFSLASIVRPLFLPSVYMRYKHRVLGLLAAGLFGFASSARAQEVQFQGVTLGCFQAAWQSSCTPASASSLLFLTYLSSSFDVTTVDGLAGIGAAPESPNVDNLGSFIVSGDPANYSGSQFFLDVQFGLPTITSSATLFTASVKGSVRSFANGLVKIEFIPSSHVFDFTSGQRQGSFTLSLNNVSMTPGATPVSLTGDIELSPSSSTTTPEPASLILMMTGVAGIAGFVRRRRRGA